MVEEGFWIRNIAVAIIRIQYIIRGIYHEINEGSLGSSILRKLLKESI